MTEKKGLSGAMLDAQSELENLCELSSDASPDQLANYKLALKSWRNVWEQLHKAGNISQSEADEAMNRIKTTCSKLGINIKEL